MKSSFFSAGLVMGLLVVSAGIANAADAPPVSGYSRWFDASKLVGLADGAPVTAWSDLSGNGANATVPTGNAAPTFVANAGTGTGLCALYFPRNSGPSNSGALRFTRDSAIRTVFAVFKGNSFLLTDASAYHFHRATDNNPVSPLWEVANSWSSASIRGGMTCVNGLPVNGTTFAMPTKAYNGFNLVEVVTTGPVSADSFNKDRSSHAGNQYHAEVILYDCVLTDAERLQVRDYLTAKWFGFDSSTPPVVTGTVPATGGSIDPLSPSVSIAFNKPMNTGSAEAAFSMDGLSGSFSWSENTLTFKPTVRLRPNTSYTVTVGTGAQSFDGVRLADPYSFSVSTASGLTNAAITMACDNAYEIYLNGALIGSGANWNSAQKYSNIVLVPGKNVVAVKGTDAGGVAALLAELAVGGRRVGTGGNCKVTLAPPADWTAVELDDSSWTAATEYGAYGVAPWSKNVSGMPTDTPARWIWSSNNDADNQVYLRWTVDLSAVSPAPENIAISHISDHVVAFTWQPAVGANPLDCYYEVYRDGVCVAVTGTPSYCEKTLSPATRYSYTVCAVNLIGNASPFSAPAEVTTMPAPPIGIGTGLLARIYDNPDLSMRKLVRVDPTLDFNWGTGAPATDVGVDTFSVQWQGQIQPRYSEQYTIYTLSDDGVRLWLDGQLMIDNWTDHAAKEDKCTISLRAGQKYDIRVD